jgi:hypothetical protein
MNTLTQTIEPKALIARIKLLFTDPKGCWAQIAAENNTPMELVKKLILPLAVLGAISMFLALSMFGVTAHDLGVMFPGTGALLVLSIVQVILSVLRLFVAAFVLQKVAPLFGGSSSFNSAFSLVAHSSVPGLLAGVVLIFPLLAVPLAFILAVFGLYLFYTGIPTMIQIPTEKRVGFIVTAIIAMILLQWFIGMIGAGFYPTPASQIAP